MLNYLFHINMKLWIITQESNKKKICLFYSVHGIKRTQT